MQSNFPENHHAVNLGDRRGRALWLAPGQAGAPVRIRLNGLLPYRFYRILPCRGLFARTDRRGRLRARLQLDRATLITIEPVV
ncbi:hypothetical protein [uncultured Sphingomonas sp.]|uniref:hypothetical protein n=1 Tax=uncultured Sphingomonas sp. TaxID=158754 RepID=UPI0025F9820C|nr:hypothetical protein [uncultured Sphingomonas sp.]